MMVADRKDAMWDEPMLATLRDIAANDELPTADRPARIVGFALMCAEMQRNSAAWPYDCAEAGKIAVQALQLVGMLPAGGNAESPSP